MAPLKEGQGVEFAALVNALWVNYERSPWAQERGLYGWVNSVVSEAEELESEAVGEVFSPPDLGKVADELGDVFWSAISAGIALEKAGGPSLAEVLERVKAKLIRRKPWIFNPAMAQPRDADEEQRLYTKNKVAVG